MPYCPKCNIEYEEGKKFCKECGSKLETRQEVDKVIVTTDEIIRTAEINKKYCPSCSTEYASDKKFCKNCGVSLTDTPITSSQKEPALKVTERIRPKTVTTPIPKVAAGVPSRFNTKSVLRKKNKLIKSEKKLVTLIDNLEKQRGAISEEALAVPMRQYQVQLEHIRKEIRETEDYLDNLQKRLSVEIDTFQKERLPYGNRLAELKAMRRARGITFMDFRRFKKVPAKAASKVNREIKRRKRVLELLPLSGDHKQRGIGLSLRIAGGCLILLILLAGGYFGYKRFFHKSVQGTLPTVSSEGTIVVISPEEEIKKVFETIKQANIKKDINLFMSCYSSSYPYCEEKKNNTMKSWAAYDFNGLQFTLKDPNITQDTAEVTVNWHIEARAKDTNQLQTFNTTNNVVLKNETGQWKITSLK